MLLFRSWRSKGTLIRKLTTPLPWQEILGFGITWGEQVEHYPGYKHCSLILSVDVI